MSSLPNQEQPAEPDDLLNLLDASAALSDDYIAQLRTKEQEVMAAVDRVILEQRVAGRAAQLLKDNPNLKRSEALKQAAQELGLELDTKGEADAT